jgi:ATP-dependent RNA helicase RhlE
MAPSFADLGLRPELLTSLDRLGFAQPTDIQIAAIPAVLEGHDALIRAETGAGKTLAYGLPLLQRLAGTPQLPRVLVVVPTRELALQVRDVLRTAARKWRPPIHAAVGGEEIAPQIKAIAKGCAVLVGTPGRLHDLVRRHAVELKHCKTLVLDEADELLLGGFEADLRALMAALPSPRQTLLVSATLGPEVRAFAEEALRDPVTVGMTTEEAPAAPAAIAHRYVASPRAAKGPILARLLHGREGQAIVFVHRIDETRRLAMKLRDQGLAAAYLSGDLPQENRKETIDRFRQGQYRVLVATDVAARGLDVPDVQLVVNYSVPKGPEQYLHRAGRTGRAGRAGEVVTLSYREEVDDLKRLKAGFPLEETKVSASPLSGIAPWRPQRPEPEAPVVSAVPAPRKRPPKVGQHLEWHEDRPPERKGRRSPNRRPPG